MLLRPPSALVSNLLKWKQLLKISTKSHRGSHLLHLAENVDFWPAAPSVGEVMLPLVEVRDNREEQASNVSVEVATVIWTSVVFSEDEAVGLSSDWKI